MNLNATLFFQLLVFFIFSLITMKFILSPLIKIIDERRQKITDSLIAANKAQNDLISTQKSIEKMKLSAKNEIDAQIAKAEKKAEIIIENSRYEAKNERDALIAQGHREIEKTIQDVRNMLRDDLAILAINCAEKILHREIHFTDHVDLLDQFKKRF